MKKSGIDPMAVTAGYARFHSSFTPKVRQYAAKYKIDVRDLIVRLCQEDLVSAPDSLLERLGREMASERLPRIISIPAFRTTNAKELKGIDGLLILLNELRSKSAKAAKYSSLNIVIGESPMAEIIVSRNIQDTKSHIIGSLTLTDESHLVESLSIADGKVDVIFLDVENKEFGPQKTTESALKIIKKSLLLTYLDSYVWVEAVEDQVVRILDENIYGKRIAIAGNHAKTRFLALRFAERLANVSIIDATCGVDKPFFHFLKDNEMVHLNKNEIQFLERGSAEALDCLSSANAVVVWPNDVSWFSSLEANNLAKKTYVIDAGIGSILPEGIALARKKGASLLRVNIWPRLAATLASAHESVLIYKENFGWGKVAGISVVAGGAMGRRGDVIVDSISKPTRVIGIANGFGGIRYRYSKKDAEKVRQVNEAIKQRLIMPNIDTES